MIRAVTLDFYGTLVTHGTCEQIYAQSAAGAVSVDVFRRRFDEEMIAYFDWLTDRHLHDLDEFPTIRVIYRNVYRKLFAEFGIDKNVENATAMLMDHVARPDLFPETMYAVGRLRERFDLCLVTDADEDMIATALEHTRIEFDHVVISETYRHYKSSKDSPLFQHALARLGTRPEETIHIGDRITDVLGAKWNGLSVIHVKRDGNGLPPDAPTPEATVRDLTEAVEWLLDSEPKASAP